MTLYVTQKIIFHYTPPCLQPWITDWSSLSANPSTIVKSQTDLAAICPYSAVATWQTTHLQVKPKTTPATATAQLVTQCTTIYLILHTRDFFQPLPQFHFCTLYSLWHVSAFSVWPSSVQYEWYYMYSTHCGQEHNVTNRKYHQSTPGSVPGSYI
jgi:hypothetical protein